MHSNGIRASTSSIPISGRVPAGGPTAFTRATWTRSSRSSSRPVTRAWSYRCGSDSTPRCPISWRREKCGTARASRRSITRSTSRSSTRSRSAPAAISARCPSATRGRRDCPPPPCWCGATTHCRNGSGWRPTNGAGSRRRNHAARLGDFEQHFFRPGEEWNEGWHRAGELECRGCDLGDVLVHFLHRRQNGSQALGRHDANVGQQQLLLIGAERLAQLVLLGKNVLAVTRVDDLQRFIQ